MYDCTDADGVISSECEISSWPSLSSGVIRTSLKEACTGAAYR